MVLGVTLIAITGGFGAAIVPGFMGTAATTTTVAGVSVTTAATGFLATGWGTALSYLGM